MARTDAREVTWDEVEVLGRRGLFTCLRIDKATVPKGWHVYEVRHDEYGEPVEIATWVLVNHWGTLITKRPIKLVPSKKINNAYLEIDPNKDWNYLGGCVNLK